METKQLKLTFCAGTGTVTGANFLLEGPNTKFLIDCGLTQGEEIADQVNWEPFQYNPADIQILFITHAHIDHIGRIPKLVHDGFRGRIISTDATMDLARPMLLDTVGILGKSDQHDLSKIYTHDMVDQIMNLWEGVPYYQPLNLEYGFKITFFDSGHILGASMIQFEYGARRMLFTGDLGNSPSPILRDTDVIHDIDYMVMESCYGDRNHEERDMRREMLAQAINENYKRRGALVMPTFSLERSQELLYELNNLIAEKKIEVQHVYFDSPLAIELTSIYEKYERYYNSDAQKLLKKGDDIFSFPGLHVTQTSDESKAILEQKTPKIIIAGSGMSNGGRVLHHEMNYLPGKENMLLLTGYQSVGTMGRKIEEGAKTVTIYHEEIPVHAKIWKISGYSGHKDSDHLVEFVRSSAHTLRQVFCVMGEPKSALFLAQKLRGELSVTARAPDVNDSVVLDF